MFTFLLLLIVLIGAVMTIAILMQNPKGGGLSSAFGGAGGGMGSVLGVRHASDILAKTTWGLAIAMVVLIFAVNMFFLPTEGTQESIIQRSAADAPMTPMQKQQQMQEQAQPQQAPAEGQPQQQAPAPQN
jgi:preprotein translocase subunit SecG